MSFRSFSIFKVNEEFLIFCEEQEFSTRLSKEQRYLITPFEGTDVKRHSDR